MQLGGINNDDIVVAADEPLYSLLFLLTTNWERKGFSSCRINVSQTGTYSKITKINLTILNNVNNHRNENLDIHHPNHDKIEISKSELLIKQYYYNNARNNIILVIIVAHIIFIIIVFLYCLYIIFILTKIVNKYVPIDRLKSSRSE